MFGITQYASELTSEGKCPQRVHSIRTNDMQVVIQAESKV